MRFWKLGLSGLVLIAFGACAWVLLHGRRVAVTPPSIRPVQLADLAGSLALQYAAKKYQQRGARYVWGTNDCSVFVSDYLLRQPKPPKSRLTTLNLDQLDVEPFGLTIEGSVKPGDVLNYRYRSKKRNQMAGHCGVVVRKTDGFWVVHNCASMGLAIQTLAGFYRTAKTMGVEKVGVTILRPQK